jgi:glucose-6-phosphate-specific signal transduction histidine kinase
VNLPRGACHEKPGAPHANASRVTISIATLDQVLMGVVEDDGYGMDESA